jgi:hypothetical protein
MPQAMKRRKHNLVTHKKARKSGKAGKTARVQCHDVGRESSSHMCHTICMRVRSAHFRRCIWRFCHWHFLPTRIVTLMSRH